jgi:phosphoglycerate dehydrogenase-like enzyme
MYEPISKESPFLPIARQPRSNLVITPHTAAGRASASSKSRAGDYTNIQRILAGEKLVGRLV